MSTTVDQRVVEMKFDNQQFESNVKNTMDTLSKLREKLNLKDASKGLDQVDAAAKRCDIGSLGNAVETVQAKFSALQVIGVTALANITNSAINTGKRMLSALTIDPIKTGFEEYETQINAVQTILANTESKGSTLKDVNEALDELNKYADLTIYNFTEMTRNIGTFTAAGIDLDTSVNAIQGIANLAAVSGSTSQQASTAMYQLSQALASGTVKLMDWNSVVNAGMGGQVFQDALRKTSEELKTGAEAAIKSKGSFRESLQTGWLTSKVLTETLKKFTSTGANEYVDEFTGLAKGSTEAALKAAEAQYGEADAIEKAAEALANKSGKNKKEIQEALQFAKTAQDAATKVKTFSQLWDTLKEAAQSGWTQSWEIIVGDFEEAKSLLTSISDTISEMINATAEARNSVLQGWKDLGGRNDLIDSFRNAFEGLMVVVNAVKDAMKDVFPPITAEVLQNMTATLKDFTSKLILGDAQADKLKRTFQGVFSILDMVRKVIVVVAGAIGSFLTSGAVGGMIDLILSVTAVIGDFFTAINNSFKFDTLSGAISSIVGTISAAIGALASNIAGFGDALSGIGQSVGGVFSDIWTGVKDVLGWLADHISIVDVFIGLVGGGLFIAFKKLSGLLGGAKDLLDGGILGILFGGGDDDPVKSTKGIGESFKEILGSVNETLQSFTTGVKIASVVAIAGAIGILANALRTISEINIVDTVKGLGAIGALMTMLSFEFQALTKSLSLFNPKGVVRAGLALVLVAESINILSDALVKMGGLSIGGIAKGLIGVAGSMLIMSKALGVLNGVKITARTTVALLVIAESCKILADAFKTFGSMSWDEIKQGLGGMGGALGELVIAIGILSKISGAKSLLGGASIYIIVKSLSDMADALKKFGSMSWNEIKRGLVGMGGALVEVGVVSGLLGKLAGFSGILGSISIVAIAGSLGEIADVLQKFGYMSWDEIGRGLAAMGGALVEVGVVAGLLGKIAGFSAILGSTSIVIVTNGLANLVDAFQQFAWLDEDEVKHGLIGLGGALAEVGIVCGLLGKIAGFSAVIGSGAILIVVQGLGQLADAFKIFAGLTWDQIGRGLAGMGGALAEVVAVTGILGSLAGLPAILGGGAILLGVQGLGQLADALKKFGEMEWDEIGRGLTAMGAALAELAIGDLLNTFSGFGAGAVASVAEPIGILADSIKKWQDVTVPAGLGLELGILASGIQTFTLGGMGAGVIASIAEPIGTLADSIKKWSEVEVPSDLGAQLMTMAAGVNSFTLSGIGADAIASIAEPLGTLASSISKWSEVTVPSNLGEQLTSLADGVKSFTTSGFAVDAIASIAEPLGVLASSIKKWADVTVPDDLGTQLTNLSSGLAEFKMSITSGATITAMAEPLNTLGDAIKKFSEISIPKNLGKKMTSLGTAIVTLATSLDVSKLPDAAKVNSFAEALEKLHTAMEKAKSIDSKAVKSFIKSINSLNDIKVDSNSLTQTANSVSTSMNKMVASMKTAVSGGKADIGKSMKTAMSGVTSEIKNTSNSVVSATGSLITDMSKTISSKSSSTNKAFQALVANAVTAVKSRRGAMVTAGKNLAEGLIEGIRNKNHDVYTAAYNMGKKAVKGEKDGQESKSPSKATERAGKWLGEGLIIGMEKMSRAVYDTGKSMGKAATESIAKAMSVVADISDSDFDASPTITPVVDLSNVKASAATLGDMLNSGVNTSLGTVNAVLSQRIQNGGNSDVVSAIEKLNKTISNLEKPTYNINGITYDDGSNIASAISTLTRAAVVERRI